MELKDSGYSIRKIEKELKANKLEASRSTIHSILNLENKTLNTFPIVF